MQRITRPVLALAIVALAATACSNTDSESSPAAATSTAPAVPLEDQEFVFANFGRLHAGGFLEDFTEQTGVEVTLSEFHEQRGHGRQAPGRRRHGLRRRDGLRAYVQTLLDNGWTAELDHARSPTWPTCIPRRPSSPTTRATCTRCRTRGARPGCATGRDLVDTEIDSWDDLLNPAPELEGKMTMLGTERWLLQPALLSLGYSINTEDPAEIDEAKDLRSTPRTTCSRSTTPSSTTSSRPARRSMVHAWDGWCNYAHERERRVRGPERGQRRVRRHHGRSWSPRRTRKRLTRSSTSCSSPRTTSRSPSSCCTRCRTRRRWTLLDPALVELTRTWRSRRQSCLRSRPSCPRRGADGSGPRRSRRSRRA